MNIRFLWAASVVAATSASVFALPLARAQVISAPDGTGTVVTVNGNEFRISGGQQAGTNLFHSFQQFGLNAEQIATFLAQPQLANILARVTGGDPSVIDGLLQVSGGSPNLYLMNPAGIVFGANASLNVPGDFFATTANAIGFDSGGWFEATGALGDLALLTGRPNQFAFDLATPAPLVNAGELAVNPGQNLTLLAGQVLNTGNLAAPGGSITLSAVPGSRRVRLSQPGHLLQLEIEPPRDAQGELLPVQPVDLPALLTGSGVETGLTAAGEAIHFTASGQSVAPRAGLTATGGSLTANSSAGAGGAIAVLGDRVALFGADLDASGTTGGGQVLVGGDYKGGGTVPNARRTLVDAGSRIQARAGENGDGGRVILWADEATGFWGEIDARGGELGGDGGFVEVSGKQQLVFEGEVDVTAAAGAAGSLLLDPENIFIFSFFSGSLPDDSAIADGRILADDAPGDTLFLSGSALTSLTGSVTLEAANDIRIFGGLEFSGADNITFTADADNNGEGEFRMFRSQRLATNGGNLTISAAEIELGEVVTSSGTGDSGDVTLLARSREVDSNISFTFIDTSNDAFAGGDVEIAANGTIRGTGINIFGNTIDVRGETAGGAIRIEYNGGPLGAPFTVGNSRLNGITGSIATNEGTLRPREVFNQPGATNIAGISVNFASAAKTISADEEGSGSEGGGGGEGEGQDTESDAAADPTLTTDISAAGTDDLNVDPTSVDRELTADFTGYLTAATRPEPVSLLDAQAVLSDIVAQTGEVPAIVYIRYAPAPSNLEASLTSRQPDARLKANPMLDSQRLGDRPAQELWRFGEPSAGGAALATPLADPLAANPNDQLELAAIFPERPPLRQIVSGVTRADVERVAAQLRRDTTSVRRANAFRIPARQLHEWLIEPLAADLEAQGVTNLAFVLAAGLRSLPVAALYDGEQFLIERYSIGLMPSLSLTDTRYRPLRNVSVLATGASEFSDQAPLPAVPFELEIIARELWPGQTLLNQDFTLSNIRNERAGQNYEIVHFGTHGEFQPGALSKSYISLGNGRLSLDRLRELGLRQPPTELLVLSACRTALGDREAELGFAGLAVQAGVKTALGSLWYVSDSGTLAFMATFYDELQTASIKAEALRQAQLALLRGETRFVEGELAVGDRRFPLPPELQDLTIDDLTHPYYWSAFTAIGSPW